MHKKTGRKKEKIFSVLFDALFYAKMGVLRHTSTYPGPNSAPDYHKTKILWCSPSIREKQQIQSKDPAKNTIRKDIYDKE